MLVFFPSFFAAQHGLSHICICMPIFHSSADHCRACIVVDGWEMATAYALPSKGGAVWLVNCHMGYFPIGDSHQWAENCHFLLFLVCCYALPYALFYFSFSCQSFAHHFRACFVVDWAKNSFLTLFLVYYYALHMLHFIFHLHSTLFLIISFPEAADTVE